MIQLARPSYANNFARSAGESANPNLWRGLVGAWVPGLGVTGSTVQDVSGYGNHGTFSANSPRWIQSINGPAVDFDGVDESIALGNSGPWDFTSEDFSAIIRLKYDTSSSGWVLGHGRTSNGGWNVDVDANRLSLKTYQSAAFQVTNTNILSADVWYHAAFVRTGADVAIYINGSSNIFSAGTHIDPDSYSANFNIGAFTISTLLEYEGDIDLVEIYKRALTRSEICQLYVDPLAPFRLRRRITYSVPAAAAGNPWYQYQQQTAGAA